MAFIDDIKRIYLQSSMLMRLIFINIAVFLLLHVVAILAMLFNATGVGVLQWVELPGDLTLLLKRPWTLRPVAHPVQHAVALLAGAHLHGVLLTQATHGPLSDGRLGWSHLVPAGI